MTPFQQDCATARLPVGPRCAVALGSHPIGIGPRLYLSRYTHRVAISNSRLIAADAQSITFKVKDYRLDGPGRYTTMTLGAHEFIRRFLLHVLPKGFHRIRHFQSSIGYVISCHIATGGAGERQKNGLYQDIDEDGWSREARLALPGVVS